MGCSRSVLTMLTGNFLALDTPVTVAEGERLPSAAVFKRRTHSIISTRSMPPKLGPSRFMTIHDTRLADKELRLIRHLWFFAVLIVAIAVPLVLSAITGNAFTTMKLMSADTLWTLALMRDIFTSGGHLAD